jgi:hypothetical protein
MSLGAIQDNLVKTNLVQQTQSRNDDVNRSQETAQTVRQHEQDRQGDQVVLMTHQSEQSGIRSDREGRGQEEGKKKRRQNSEEDTQEEATDTSGRHEMHRINIVI